MKLFKYAIDTPILAYFALIFLSEIVISLQRELC